MKYFTKEWYELSQKCSFHLPLEEDQKAETFSEEYFQQLYHVKLNERIDFRKEIALIENEPFDREKSTIQFNEAFNYNQEYIISNLPENILKMIADVRVFVLDRASRKVIETVTQFCEGNEKSIRNTIEEYELYYKKSLDSLDKNIVKKINFHDCKVIDLIEYDKSLRISLDHSGGFTEIDEVIFENFLIKKQDGSLENSWWLHDELYNVEGNYELHVLLQNENMELIEFIISAENIRFEEKENEVE